MNVRTKRSPLLSSSSHTLVQFVLSSSFWPFKNNKNHRWASVIAKVSNFHIVHILRAQDKTIALIKQNIVHAFDMNSIIPQRPSNVIIKSLNCSVSCCFKTIFMFTYSRLSAQTLVLYTLFIVPLQLLPLLQMTATKQPTVFIDAVKDESLPFHQIWMICQLLNIVYIIDDLWLWMCSSLC